MKLLFDENLAPRLAVTLSGIYPGSVHLRDCDLRGSSDAMVWDYARENGFVIVSKDSDFSHRSSLFGSPPKVVWLRIGTAQRRAPILFCATRLIVSGDSNQEPRIAL